MRPQGRPFGGLHPRISGFPRSVPASEPSAPLKCNADPHPHAESRLKSRGTDSKACGPHPLLPCLPPLATTSLGATKFRGVPESPQLACPGNLLLTLQLLGTLLLWLQTEKEKAAPRKLARSSSSPLLEVAPHLLKDRLWATASPSTSDLHPPYFAHREGTQVIRPHFRCPNCPGCSPAGALESGVSLPEVRPLGLAKP